MNWSFFSGVLVGAFFGLLPPIISIIRAHRCNRRNNDTSWYNRSTDD